MKKADEIRRENVRALVARDGLAATSRRFGKPDRQINDMISGRKSFGEKVARAMEAAYAPSRAAGWLDEPGGLDEQMPPQPESNLLYPSGRENTGFGVFYEAHDARAMPYDDPIIITDKDIIGMTSRNHIPPEFRYLCLHDQPGGRGELSIPAGHWAIMDSTVEHRSGDIVLAMLPSGPGLRRVMDGTDGPLLVGEGEAIAVTPDAIIAVAVGAATPRIRRPKKKR